MNEQGKSHRSRVPTKPPNNAGTSAAEVVEGQDLAKENVGQQNTHRTQCRARVHSELEGVRQIARRDKEVKFTALFHHITIERLRLAFMTTNRKAATGIDAVTWEQYEVNLEANLLELHQRLRRGAYRAKPSRRVYIPTGEVLNAIYEEDFLDFSYGFRPGRGQHDALDALTAGIKRKKVSFVLDADIRGFFDAISHGWLVKFVEHRIADKRVLRLIQKWLSAGVMENGTWTKCEEGTPQGATISPLLANIYLHYVLDLWSQQWRNRSARGDVVVTRFADDFIVGFQYRSDAGRFLRELKQRLQQFSLELHPEKTRLIEFGRFAAKTRANAKLGAPETFNFLGFTHACGTTESGKFQVERRTMQKRMTAKLHELKLELQQRRHQPIPEQGRWLCQGRRLLRLLRSPRQREAAQILPRPDQTALAPCASASGAARPDELETDESARRSLDPARAMASPLARRAIRRQIQGKNRMR